MSGITLMGQRNVCDYYWAYHQGAIEMDSGNYQKAVEQYSLAFRSAQACKEKNDMGYYVAYCFTKIGILDSAIHYLTSVVNHCDFYEADWLTSCEEFKVLYASPLWTKIVEKAAVNAALRMSKMNIPLALKLEEIYESDQSVRVKQDSLEKQFGVKSIQVAKHWDVIHILDSANFHFVDSIIAVDGWLGIEVVGVKGNTALWLTIQHAGLTDQVRYLLILKDAVSKGNANAADYALLEDRIAIQQGRKQMYGSQLGMNETNENLYFYPIENVLEVNNRRCAIGLEPIEIYAQYWGVSFESYSDK